MAERCDIYNIIPGANFSSERPGMNINVYTQAGSEDANCQQPPVYTEDCLVESAIDLAVENTDSGIVDVGLAADIKPYKCAVCDLCIGTKVYTKLTTG